MYFLSDSTKFCRYCGASIPVDSEFCEKCGKVLTPVKEIVKTSQPEVVRERQTPRRGKLLLAIIVIALVLSTVFVLSFAPNPLVKNRPWVTVEGISFYQETSYDLDTGLPTNEVYSFLIITIHNPTHSTPTFELSHANLDAYLSYQFGNFSRTFRYTRTTTNFQIFEGGNWTKYVVHPKLPACSPTVVGPTSPRTRKDFQTRSITEHST